MPSLFCIDGYKVYFCSNECGEPIHVHVSRGRPSKDAPKFWILSDGSVVPASNYNIKANDLRKIINSIYTNKRWIIGMWILTFNGISFYR